MSRQYLLCLLPLCFLACTSTTAEQKETYARIELWNETLDQAFDRGNSTEARQNHKERALIWARNIDKESSPAVRSIIVRSLPKLFHDDIDTGRDLLIEVIQKEEEDIVRLECANALAEIPNNRVIGVLGLLLTNRDQQSGLLVEESSEIRALSARILGDLGTFRAATVLIPGLQDPVPWVRYQVEQALNRVEGQRNIRGLEQWQKWFKEKNDDRAQEWTDLVDVAFAEDQDTPKDKRQAAYVLARQWALQIDSDWSISTIRRIIEDAPRFTFTIEERTRFIFAALIPVTALILQSRDEKQAREELQNFTRLVVPAKITDPKAVIETVDQLIARGKTILTERKDQEFVHEPNLRFGTVIILGSTCQALMKATQSQLARSVTIDRQVRELVALLPKLLPLFITATQDPNPKVAKVAGAWIQILTKHKSNRSFKEWGPWYESQREIKELSWRNAAGQIGYLLTLRHKSTKAPICDTTTRLFFANALEKYAEFDVAGFLVKALDDPDQNVRQAIQRALGKMSEDNIERTPQQWQQWYEDQFDILWEDLVSQAFAPGLDSHSRLAWLLQLLLGWKRLSLNISPRIQKTLRNSVEAFVAFLRSEMALPADKRSIDLDRLPEFLENPVVRELSWKSLKTGLEQSLRKRDKSGALEASPAARLQAVELLGFLQELDAVPILIKGLRDPDSKVREQSAAALQKISKDSQRRAANEWLQWYDEKKKLESGPDEEN